MGRGGRHYEKDTAHLGTQSSTRVEACRQTWGLAVTVKISIASLLRTMVGLSLVGASLVVNSPSVAATLACSQRSLDIVAHQDDDLLFMNPSIQHDINAGVCVTTVFLTAGDDGQDSSYWLGRELGSQSAYATMLGAPTSWTASQRSFAGHSIHTTSNTDGSLDLVYLRLPDGGMSGAGFPSTGNQSLSELRSGAISTIQAIDGSSTYSGTGLVQTIAAIVAATGPSTIRLQDGRSDQGDHPDHQTGALFALDALAGYQGTVTAYRDYNVVNDPANVSGNDLVLKTNAVVSYANHDPLLCSNLSTCPDGVTAQWTERQYTAPLPWPLSAVPGPAPYTGPNVARNAAVLASSQVTGQEATKAIDSVISGYPANASAEWSTAGQGAGAWLQLYWSSAQTIDRVYLYDRPNSSDQVTGATLTFSDGTTVPVPALANDGTATIVTFTARTTTTLKFTVTSVSSSTSNIGLAEIEAYNGDPNGTVPPPTPVPGPAPYTGPNVARNAAVLASSQVTGQEATKAIDSVISGYPANASAEWSTAGQGAGAWLQLYWSSAQTIDRVYLYDRPNSSDQVTGATLTFSDGTTVPVPALANDGTATIVTFTARTTTTLKFTVTSVSSSTLNIGLAEIEAYNGDPNGTVPAPSVASVTPAAGAVGVAVTSPVVVTFSGQSVPAAVSVMLTGPGGTAVQGTLVTSALTATFTPSAVLAAGASYTVTVTASSTTGTAMAPFTSTFSTEGAVSVASTSPASNATGVAATSTVSATFSGPVAISSVSLTLTPSGGSAVAGALTTTTTTATFTPSTALAASTVYTVTATASSTSGAVMAPYAWSFTTSAGLSAPTIATRTPTSGATGVSAAATVSVTFTAAVDPAQSVVSLVDASGAAVAGTLATTSTQATFTPAALLAANTRYTATARAASPQGTAMTPSTWSFTTETAPTVASVSPANGATNVSSSTTVQATFSKAVVRASISVVVADPNGAVVTGSLATTTTKGTFTPSTVLAPGTVYSVTVSATLSDGLSSTAFTSHFTTAAAVNIFPASLTPASSTTSPTPLTVGVKFRSTTAYSITGIRFYLPANWTGTYTVTLWSANGTKLATATGSPTSTTAGWRTVTFASPVKIAANSTYVASVRGLAAEYSSTTSAFRTTYTNGTFSVPVSGGVSSLTDVFPTSSSTTNYFVDVVAQR